MLRWVGALFLIGGAASVGFGAVCQLQARVRCLSGMCAALEAMERELSFRLTPLPALFSRLARTAPEPVRAVFLHCRDGCMNLGEKSLETLWAEGIETISGPLKEEEGELLLRLGGVLGRYDGERQRASIADTRARLEQLLRQAAEDRARLGRVYGAVSVTAGLLLVLLLA